MVKATDKVKQVVEEKVGPVAATGSKPAEKPAEKPADKPAEKPAEKPADTTPGKTTSSLLPPQIGVGTQFAAENMDAPTNVAGNAPKGGKVNAPTFQKEVIKEARTEKMIGSVAEKIAKESQVFVDALNKLAEARTSGLEAKDLGPQIKAVDTSWDKLLKLYGKNEELATVYGAQISELEDINFDNDAELDLLIGGEGDEPDQLEKYTPEQLDAMLEKEIEEELNQLESMLDQLEKEMESMEQAG